MAQNKRKNKSGKGPRGRPKGGSNFRAQRSANKTSSFIKEAINSFLEEPVGREEKANLDAYRDAIRACEDKQRADKAAAIQARSLNLGTPGCMCEFCQQYQEFEQKGYSRIGPYSAATVLKTNSQKLEELNKHRVGSEKLPTIKKRLDRFASRSCL